MNSSQQRRAASERAEESAQTGSEVWGHLVEATIELIQAGGPEAATSRAIAEMANENLAAITYYFGSKHDLVSQAMLMVARRLIQPVLVEFLDDDKDGVSKLLGAVQQLYRVLEDNENLLGPYLHCLAAAPTNESVSVEVHSLLLELTTVLETEMEAQKRDQRLPAWVQPRPMAQLIVALVNGVAVGVALDPEGSDPIGIGTQFTQLLLNSQRPPSN